MATTSTLSIDGEFVDLGRLGEVCQRYGVVQLSVFGSIARGEHTDASDVDLLYVLDPDARLGFAISQLEDELTEILGRPVDLVAERALHRLIRDDVLADARMLYEA